jgi:hypothetical protein
MCREVSVSVLKLLGWCARSLYGGLSMVGRMYAMLLPPYAGPGPTGEPAPVRPRPPRRLPPPAVTAAYLADPPADHPEQMCPEVPPGDLERALFAQLFADDPGPRQGLPRPRRRSSPRQPEVP